MMLTEEEEQTLGGRIVAVIVRLEELEEVLVKKCKKVDWISKYNEWNTFGVLKNEEVDGMEDLIDKEVLKNPLFGMNRAECLLAVFLETIEKPGLARNGVIVPCMDVDFLDSDRYEALFLQKEEEEKKKKKEEEEITQQQKEEEDAQKAAQEKLQEALQEIENKQKEVPPKDETKQIGDKLREATGIRPSLHPVTINAIAEALKIRAQNNTRAPLRLITEGTEFWEIQYQAGKIAENAVIKRQKSSDKDGMTLTEEEAQTVGGRIVGVIMRLDDLEWELHHRVTQTAWVGKYDEWSNFGTLQDESCIKTLDEMILNDPLFAMNRAERLLALFLLNLEGPGMKAAGEFVPGGSDVDFLEEDHYTIMLPKKK